MRKKLHLAAATTYIGVPVMWSEQTQLYNHSHELNPYSAGTKPTLIEQHT